MKKLLLIIAVGIVGCNTANYKSSCGLPLPKNYSFEYSSYEDKFILKYDDTSDIYDAKYCIEFHSKEMFMSYPNISNPTRYNDTCEIKYKLFETLKKTVVNFKPINHK